jgi:Flp pilus assembly protein TadD
VALLAAWYTWQPLRAQNANNGVTAALKQKDGRTALDHALNATRYQPEALQSWQTLSTVFQALHYWPKARAALVTGTEKQPRNPASWTALGTYYLCNGRPHEAVAPLTRATQLNVTILANPTDPTLLAQGLAAARAGSPPPAKLCR